MINLVTLQENLENLSQNFSKESFIFDLLSVYELPKSTISLLSKSPSKLSGKEDQIILKNKVLFHITTLEEDEHVAIDALQKDKSSYKFNPRFIIVTDFVTFLAIDTKTKETLDIQIEDLGKHYAFFLPWCGMEKSQHVNENPADIRAAYKMDKLYQAIVNDNTEYYKNNSHDLNIFLSRLLFCFFAEDTGIFPKTGMFTNSVTSHTHENGNEMGIYFSTFFDVLNTKDSERSKYASHFLEFPYVNGGLFESKIKLPTFTASSRKLIIECGKLDWSSINPDIFGSMIQAVVHPGQRENLGMHYTSVPNIMKVIEPLFLNNLYEEVKNSKNDTKKLVKLRERIAKIKIFDPACGSGNFLIISYKELCKLEIEIIRLLNLQNSFATQEGWNSTMSGITLNNFYGIEIDDFAHEIAKLSLYLAQHQINIKFQEEFGKLKPTLPLKESGRIVYANATRIDWDEVCLKKDRFGNEYEIYIIGNPPYLGSKNQDIEQKNDMAITFKGVEDYKKLDYVACWFYIASSYIQNTNVQYAFVTTNSITQGEQVSLLWNLILSRNQEIFLAHQSFKWTNNAKGNAGVAVVVIGIRNINDSEKYLYNQDHRQLVKNISPYLTNTSNIFILPRNNSLGNFPLMITGSGPGDDGNLILDIDEKEKLIIQNNKIESFLKKYIGAQEFIGNTYRYCIYITQENVSAAYKITQLVQRFEKVKAFRLASKKEGTKKKAVTPHFFDEDRYRDDEFILVPKVGSERREYLPIGYFDGTFLPSNTTKVIYNAKPWLFGILSSKMHIVWVRAVAGRLKTDMQYSNTLCYNTFPFPNVTEKQKESLSSHVYNILEERERYPEKSMAELYDPDKMPNGLREAHRYLDQAIDQIYRGKPFESDDDRLAHLFKLYEEMIIRKNNE
ncbi:MAG: hypothetical protein US42_C0003G0058 [Candidatus Magasanikbacteria bacterium GW2011_GWC2_37_14]|uniref:site-specific DNA-methyltransferase (adenine-specific) n=1 Tax=Candidatus Magasanikbacteria bacterium GW2011_GWC2_37_14 TaxID=1619046 RepID=A0A0G0JIT1_9BACT|nr:MAG: hypothetical protein US42_C0003G0058 [Candidatus Magasanikbacteria bacterium GW2011_GWC2_37_14]